jgi:aspartate aminotransferase-like enzyme
MLNAGDTTTMVNLRLPGPTPVPDDVVEAVSKPMIDHRGEEFHAIMKRLTANLQKAFETRNEVYVLTSSGTGGMEAAIVNVLSPGDKVLAVSIGNFGDRFSKIAKGYGANVTDLKFPEGQAADPTVIGEKLKADSTIETVLVTHNETSTGITNDLEAIAKVVKGEFDKLLVVDAISSLGSLRLAMDEWSIDVVASASQKGWACPPGLAMVAMSARAWEASDHGRMPRFYFDLREARNSLKKGETPWTPAVSLIFGLDYALRKMLATGDMTATYQFHARIAQYTRDGLTKLGLRLVATDVQHASNTVTACYLPDGVTDAALLTMLMNDYNIVAAEGRGLLAGKCFRIGHMGYVTENDIDDVLNTLEQALPRLGYKPDGVH